MPFRPQGSLDTHGRLQQVPTDSHGCCLDVWIPGCLDAWMSGYLDTWIPGYLDTWIPACLHAPSQGSLVVASVRKDQMALVSSRQVLTGQKTHRSTGH